MSAGYWTAAHHISWIGSGSALASRRIDVDDAPLSCERPTIQRMSYSVTLWCGCTVYVSCNPVTGLAHSRIVESHGSTCTIRRHDVGARLWLWELLPDQRAKVPDIEFTLYE
jgi:hypothetical protein